MRTRITELLGIRYPIIQASMAWITDAELAAAVSEAGGLGTIGPNAGSRAVTTDIVETGERLREQINKCRKLTDKPFAVNFMVGVVGWDRDFSDECVKVGIDERVPVAIVSQGNPVVYTEMLKRAILEATDTSTMAIRHGSPVPTDDERRGDRGFVEERRGSLRMLLNDSTKEMLARAGGDIAFEEAWNAPGTSEESPDSNRTVAAFVFGDLEDNAISAGQGAGMIDDIPTCRELVERLVGGVEPILERLNAIASRPKA